jgi:hypothetical protein
MSYCIALKKQAIVTPIVLGMYGIGSAVGPLVGGAITDNKLLTWRFIFWINLRKFLTMKKHLCKYYQLTVASFRGCWTGSGLVHLEEPSTRCKWRATMDAEDTPTRYSRRYFAARRNVMFEPGSTVGWHCLSMV